MILAREESPPLQRKMLMDHGHHTGHWTSEVESSSVHDAPSSTCVLTSWACLRADSGAMCLL